MSQSQSSRIQLTLKQRIFVAALFFFAMLLSYFVVFTLDPLAANLHLTSQKGRESEFIAGVRRP
jgi:hypothetical protein